MPRLLGISAIVCLVALACSAAAQASKEQGEFMTEGNKYPATLSGEQVEGDPIVYNLGGNKIECSTATVTGEATKKATTVTLHPSFSGCSAFGFGEATVTTTGCDFTYTFHNELAVDTWDATVDTECIASNEIVVAAGTCEVRIEPQEGVHTVEWVDDTVTGKVTIRKGVTGKKYRVAKDGLACPFFGTGKKEDGKVTGRYVLGGTYEGKAINVTVE